MWWVCLRHTARALSGCRDILVDAMKYWHHAENGEQFLCPTWLHYHNQVLTTLTWVLCLPHLPAMLTPWLFWHAQIKPCFFMLMYRTQLWLQHGNRWLNCGPTDSTRCHHVYQTWLECSEIRAWWDGGLRMVKNLVSKLLRMVNYWEW